MSLRQIAAQRAAKMSEALQKELRVDVSLRLYFSSAYNSVAAHTAHNACCCSCRSQQKPSVIVSFDEMHYAVNSDIIKNSF